MTLPELINRLTPAIAVREGFFVTEAQANPRGLKFPTRAQRNASRGNIYEWRDSRNRPYPGSGGYAGFVAWASARATPLRPSSSPRGISDQG